jgi:Photosynthetic reaction centre cytochrome C subunit
MHRTKKFIIFLGLGTFIMLGIAATSPQAPAAPPHKNLKILPKDISDEELHKIMRGYSEALGVKCNFCHAASKDPNQKFPDFASDEKPEKNIARKMMKMAAKINKKYFSYEKDEPGGHTGPAITCGVCHHGKQHPEFIAPPQESRPPAPPPPANN